MMEIGIYGGTFDPVHIGHAVVGSYVAQFGGVDEVSDACQPSESAERRTKKAFHRLPAA